jgi:hypothetical protein
MKRVSLHVVVAALAGVTFVASPARGAETLFIPFVSVNAGGPGGSGVGASVGTTVAGVVGADFDFGYSPDFFGGFLNSHVVTAMGNVTLSIPFDRAHAAGIRPYLTGGMGLVRVGLDSPVYGYSIAANDVGLNAGGGVIGFFGNHFGVRADLRYIHSLEDDYPANPSTPIDLSRLHFWRTSFGLVLR